jgi:hypothetical protein
MTYCSTRRLLPVATSFTHACFDACLLHAHATGANGAARQGRWCIRSTAHLGEHGKLCCTPLLKPKSGTEGRDGKELLLLGLDAVVIKDWEPTAPDK